MLISNAVIRVTIKGSEAKWEQPEVLNFQGNFHKDNKTGKIEKKTMSFTVHEVSSMARGNNSDNDTKFQEKNH